jgi:ketosteroid isomerase-like protein
MALPFGGSGHHSHEQPEDTMDAKTNAVTGAGIKRAIETRDGRALTNFYTDDAVLQIVDRNNPPSKPREVKGKTAIGTFWDDICSRAMTHQVESSVVDGNQLAFSQACAYPDGLKVLCMALCELKGGKIARQTVVQAWDE